MLSKTALKLFSCMANRDSKITVRFSINKQVQMHPAYRIYTSVVIKHVCNRLKDLVASEKWHWKPQICGDRYCAQIRAEMCLAWAVLISSANQTSKIPCSNPDTIVQDVTCLSDVLNNATGDIALPNEDGPKACIPLFTHHSWHTGMLLRTKEAQQRYIHLSK